MKIYSTKYALTKGIIAHEVLESAIDNVNGTVRIQLEYGGFDLLFGEGKEWHRTYEGAAYRAESMAVKKITALKKQIARLEAFAESMRAIK